MMIKTLGNIKKIADEYSEVEIIDYYYDGYYGYVSIMGNPYEGQIWRVISKMEYINNVIECKLNLSNNKDDDYDVLQISFIEPR